MTNKYKKKCNYKYTKQESLNLDLANTKPGYYGRSTKNWDSRKGCINLFINIDDG